MTRRIQCIKLGREAEGLAFAPVPGPLGQKLYDQVSQEAWQEWLQVQTRLVNENRLNLADPRARKYLMQQLEQYFFGDGQVEAHGFVPPPA